MDLSPFYRWETPLPDRPGAMLRSEAMPDQPEITAAAEGLRILHTSTDVRWRSGQVPVSGVLYLPKGRAPAGGWPLFAWAHGTLGIADVCAPSWTGLRARDATYLNRWLEAGFAVVATDYQGLGGPGPHPYLYWPAEGRSVLDSVRAALAEKPGLIANRVVIAGQSQGSGAALGAAKLAAEYAPELNISGVIATGVNVTFPDGPVSLPERNSANLFLSLASGGLRDDGPRIEDIVSPKGEQLLARAREACTKEIGLLARELKAGSLADALSISLDELAAVRIPVTQMDMEPIDAPVMVGTGLSDATTTPMLQYAAVSAMCVSGGTVGWRRYPGLGHDGAMHGSLDDSIAFARRALAGEAISSDCSALSPPGPPGALNPQAPFNED
ncbi:MAG: lipase family protein [Phenylobacterium sp.]|uniref:lipase family protein n=1 Tax=Phenylobacterium sp. TaxID=1871053 RepID=UPI00391CD198